MKLLAFTHASSETRGIGELSIVPLHIQFWWTRHPFSLHGYIYGRKLFGRWS